MMTPLAFRKFLVKMVDNWPAKVISIALALLLFVFHRMSNLADRFFSVPLNVEVEGNMIPSSSYPRTIRISLRGDAASVNSILEDDIEAYVNLTRFETPGNYRVPVMVRRKGTALGVEPLEISVEPMELAIALDNKISKYVPLAANVRGQVEEGYTLSSFSLNPTQVVIDGPSLLVGTVRELTTDYIDLNGRTGDFSVMVNILNQNPLLMIQGNGITEFRGFVTKKAPPPADLPPPAAEEEPSGGTE
jgi:YbbR domain-containing protein